MTGYLDRLAARVAAPARGLAPRPRSRYEDTERAVAPAVETIETTTEPWIAPPASTIGSETAAALTATVGGVIERAGDARPLARPTPPAGPATVPAATVGKGPTHGDERRPNQQDVVAPPPDRSAQPVPSAPAIATGPSRLIPIADGLLDPPMTAPATPARVELADGPDGAAELISDAAPPSGVSASRRQRGRPAAVDTPAPVIVEVTIGRVEIRGTREPVRAASPSAAAAPALTDYLRERRGGR